MNFRQFVFRNVTRSKRLYLAYVLSSIFTVMIFFTFSIFSYHPVILNLDLTIAAAFSLSTSKWIIYVFSIFYILYSMNVFLKSRKKEFGQLMILGISGKQLRFLVFWENVLIGIVSITGGIFLGLIFAKAILMIGENILEFKIRLSFYFPFKAIALTILCFSVLFICISFFITKVVRGGTVINLLKSGDLTSKEPEASGLLSLLGAAGLLAGYYSALHTNLENLSRTMVPTIIMVMLGTYLLISQFSVFLIHFLRRNEAILWRKSNMVLISDLAYRMKDNTRTFFLVAMISTVSCCSIGSFYSLQNMVDDTLSTENPFSLYYLSYPGNPAEREHILQINNKLAQAHTKTSEVSEALHYYTVPGGAAAALIVSSSQYNHFARILDEPGTDISAGSAIVVHSRKFNSSQESSFLTNNLISVTGSTVKVTREISSSVIRSHHNYIVMADEDYARLPKPIKIVNYYVWYTGTPYPELSGAGEQLSKELEGTGSEFEFYARDYEILYSRQSIGSILFVGLFVGVVLFLSAGSFLYFRLFCDLDADKAKFKSVSRIGITRKELTGMLTRQIFLVFLVPTIITLTHGMIAMITLSVMFQYSLLKESVTVLGIYLLIQAMYFLIVRFFYIKAVKAAL
ncbi:ABC transporter permease [Paenibacillus sp. MMS20-IR301]|uniref:ABC transporter permease n=1 Tax=Paenibacillus sp. MMS20-IR301 TaxID=2895946 RepID=UPI0028F09B63|nr:ABC transporter permease [Paenibacillus sp. MMS20-IR301]WNS41178.1 ABC transporter permease [Paenibacillus sp. MMS20-IR301]